MPAAASAQQSATLEVAFLPNWLGHATSVRFDARVSAPAGAVPSPLSGVTMHYPSSLGFSVSGLGLATCSLARLEAHGPTGCPANSVMGHGSVLVAVPFGPVIESERARVAIVRAPQKGGAIALLFYAEGNYPVSAEIPFSGALVDGPVGNEAIAIDVPLVKGLPDGPYVAVVQLQATLGPLGLTYLERVRGQLVPYSPRGILLPRRCPHGGFPFSADLTFLDGSQAEARTSVPCGHMNGARRDRAAHGARARTDGA